VRKPGRLQGQPGGVLAGAGELDHEELGAATQAHEEAAAGGGEGSGLAAGEAEDVGEGDLGGQRRVLGADVGAGQGHGQAAQDLGHGQAGLAPALEQHAPQSPAGEAGMGRAGIGLEDPGQAGGGLAEEDAGVGLGVVGVVHEHGGQGGKRGRAEEAGLVLQAVGQVLDRHPGGHEVRADLGQGAGQGGVGKDGGEGHG